MTEPVVGEVFAFAVAPRVELLLRVVAEREGAWCVVVSRYASAPLTKPPRALRLFEVEALTHHQWNRPMIGGWVNVAPPKTLRRLGVVRVRPEEVERVLHPSVWVKHPAKTAALAAKVLPVSGWDLILRDAKAQWRWVHERAAVLAEDEAQARERANTLAAALEKSRRQQQRLAQQGVRALKSKRFFAAWKGAVPRPMIDTAEQTLRAAVLALDGRTPAQATKKLTAVMHAFNRLDGKHEHSFDTIEREDIVEALGTIARACGVDDQTFDDVIDAAREF